MLPQNLMFIKVLRRGRKIEDDIMLENEDLVVDFKLFEEDWHYEFRCILVCEEQTRND
jgi:hypothetical protein